MKYLPTQKTTLTAILLIISIILFFLLLSQCNKTAKLSTFEAMYKASQDTLSRERNSMNQEIATKQLLYGDLENLKKINKELAAKVDKHTIGFTKLAVSTSNTVTGNTTQTAGDTIWVGDTAYVFPTYTTLIENEWERIDVKADSSRISVDYMFNNKFEITQRFEKQGKFPFKKEVPIVQVKSLNPNTITVGLDSYQVEVPKQRKWVSFAIGVAAGSATTMYLNSKIK